MATEITIFEPQNVGTIAKVAPQAYKENSISHDRCIQFGQQLLDRAINEGMSDALDQEIATFIIRAKKTVMKMNSKRSAVTQLFDSIRSAYTALENEVDPSRKGTVAAQLQEHRNKYAAKKREEYEAEMRRKQMAQRINQERAGYSDGCKELIRKIVNDRLDQRLALIRKYLAGTSLDNYTVTVNAIRDISTGLDMQNIAFQLNQAAVALPHNSLDMTDKEEIRNEVCKEMLTDLARQFSIAVESERQQALDMMPSKRKELERIAQADKEEAERIKKQMEERERKEAEQREQERAEREQREKAAAELAAKKQEMNGLFGAAELQVSQYQPKTSVKKRINVLNSEGFMEVLGMWWAQYGCTLTVAELEKEFKKQLTYCNKLANDKQHPVFIQSEHIEYVDDVKAK